MTASRAAAAPPSPSPLTTSAAPPGLAATVPVAELLTQTPELLAAYETPSILEHDAAALEAQPGTDVLLEGRAREADDDQPDTPSESDAPDTDIQSSDSTDDKSDTSGDSGETSDLPEPAGHDHHLTPEYEGTDEEQEAAAVRLADRTSCSRAAMQIIMCTQKTRASRPRPLQRTRSPPGCRVYTRVAGLRRDPPATTAALEYTPPPATVPWWRPSPLLRSAAPPSSAQP